jgi:hypothetical protein
MTKAHAIDSSVTALIPHFVPFAARLERFTFVFNKLLTGPTARTAYSTNRFFA